MNSISTISQYAAALREGRSSSAALTEAALERIGAPEGEGGRAFTRVYAEPARAAARASDMLRAAGLSRSVIDGLPISIKDLFDIAGETTMAGSVARQAEPAASEHAAVVKRLLAAGAVVIGRTNMTEFAYSGLGINPHYGTPLNAWDRRTGRIPGGSTSGGAVSVTDGMAVAAIGSDTGGSVRIPAALCGVVGFKPTARRVPTTGVLPLSPSLDSIGPLARSVACCARLDAILSGEDYPLPPPATLRGLRLAVPGTLALESMDAHVAVSFQSALTRLSASGALVHEIPVPAFAKLAGINARGGITAAEAWAWHRELIARAADHYDPRVVSRILRGRDMSAADYLDVLHARTCWKAEVEASITGFDALVMPTAPIVAPAVAELVGSDEAYFRSNGLMLRNPTLINFLDGCALSIPCHEPDSAPVGLMVAGPALSDQRIISIGVIFLAGLSWRILLGLLFVGCASLPLLWSLMHDYQRRRILTLVDPTSDPLGAGYHILQSIIAVGSGGLAGKGWLKGTQAHLEFIPERSTDFIFAVYSEEFGLIGNCLLLLLYLLLIGRGLAIAANAPSFFTRLLAGAVTLTFFTYAFVNMGMVSGILPVVGVPLPLISFGGTALVTLFVGIGILMSIHRHRKLVQT